MSNLPPHPTHYPLVVGAFEYLLLQIDSAGSQRWKVIKAVEIGVVIKIPLRNVIVTSA
jgi:hypothetical protein